MILTLKDNTKRRKIFMFYPLVVVSVRQEARIRKWRYGTRCVHLLRNIRDLDTIILPHSSLHIRRAPWVIVVCLIGYFCLYSYPTKTVHFDNNGRWIRWPHSCRTGSTWPVARGIGTSGALSWRSMLEKRRWSQLTTFGGGKLATCSSLLCLTWGRRRLRQGCMYDKR